ncbi:hypothetical protein MHYP_G00101450 [Metynnis hypsauchen]
MSTVNSSTNLPFDPCNDYHALNNDWRRTDMEFYTSYSGFDDTLVEWSGWYRLYLQGKSAQIPESGWCWSFMTCGGYTPLLLGGSHPKPQDGIVTRDIYGSYGFVFDSSECNSYRSNPIQVKACPGDYYIYRLVKPVVSIPMPTYCAVVFEDTKYDPCYNYTALDQPWRATNATGLWICDSNFNWTGWYRLLYYGMSVRMPESCVDENRCGTYVSLWLNGSHPQKEDGIVTRAVCGDIGWGDCCFLRSTPIRVKACPGNYYVYEFVKPYFCNAAYCADVNTIDPNTTLNSTPTVAATNTSQNLTFDPCNVSSILDDYWRSVDDQINGYASGYDDTLLEWNGWYQLYIQGRRAQIPESEWCWSYMSCGGYTPLFLGGSHPRPQDGIVTREIYGTYRYVTDSSQCNSYRSNPIQVKACPGDYYVYKLVKPAVSIPMPTYCAVAYNTLSYDPCNNYTALDQPWRGTNETGMWICDSNFNRNGWYRLLYNGMSIRMPESCVKDSCGTYIPLWLNGSHPEIEDGIVTHRVCGNDGWDEDCCSYSAYPIRVKACPGNYYVYEFSRPIYCFASYCADVNTITPNSTLMSVTSDATPSINSTDTPGNMTYDPCNVYTVLDNEWRRPDSMFDSYSNYDDTLVKWSGWYRLYLQGRSAQIPESYSCVSFMSCGGYTALLLEGSHPHPQEGIVTRDIYGYVTDRRQCNTYRSNPIQVKACPGNYYVYKLVKPAVSLPIPTYCAVVLETLTYDPCNNYTSLDQPWRGTNDVAEFNCDDYFNWNGWYRLLYNGMSVRMPESCVDVFRCGTYITLWLNGSHPQEEDGIVTRGVCGNIGSGDCCYLRSTPIRVKACPGNYYVYEFVKPYFCAAYCAGSAAAALMSFKNLSSVLDPSLFSTTNATQKTMMSTVISAILPRATNQTLTTPVNFTMKHIGEIDRNGILSCVYWNDTQWVVDGCSLLQTNSSHSVCSCVHLSTFALIMQIDPLINDNSDPVIDVIGTIAVAIGLVFLSLALLTFVLCRRNPRVTNTARINLCISLLLAHLLFLLTQKFLTNRPTQQMVCAALAGILHFFFLSAFVWMFIDAAVLFIFMKNLTKIRSNKKAGFVWKLLVVVGYAIPLFVVGVSAGVVPGGYGSKSCWLEKSLLWSFLGPVCFILAANTILFICILIIIISTLTNMKSKSLKIKRPESEHRFIISVALKTMMQFIILGCSWILGFFTGDSKALEIIFLLLNSQQGTFIFLVYCVLNQEVSHHLL